MKIASSAAVARVGEFVTLLAVGRDREQGELRFRWQASDPAVLPVDLRAPRVPFLAIAPGDYKIECVASDGHGRQRPRHAGADRARRQTANRPPEAPAV